MGYNKDFDWVRGKVPRYDSEGESITNDSLGAGGRRRDDGTYSGVAYDLEIEDDEYHEADNSGAGPEDELTDSIGAIAVAAAVIAAGVLGVLVGQHKGNIKSWLLASVVTPIKNRWRKLFTRLKSPEAQATIEELENPDPVEPADLSKEIAQALKNDRIIMGSTEAKQRYLEITLAMEIIARHMNDMQNALVVDDEKLQELQKAAGMLVDEQGTRVLNELLDPVNTPLEANVQVEFIRLIEGDAQLERSRTLLQQEALETRLRLPHQESSTDT